MSPSGEFMPDVIDLLKRDHREVEQLFGAFERDPQPSLAEVVAELQKVIEHQVEDEEGTVFPRMESDLGKIELEAIGADVQEFKGPA